MEVNRISRYKMTAIHAAKIVIFLIIAFISGSYFEYNSRAFTQLSNITLSHGSYVYCDTEECVAPSKIELYCESSFSYMCDDLLNSMRENMVRLRDDDSKNTKKIEGRISVNENTHDGYTISLHWSSQTGAEGEISYNSLQGRIWSSPTNRISEYLSTELKEKISNRE